MGSETAPTLHADVSPVLVRQVGTAAPVDQPATVCYPIQRGPSAICSPFARLRISPQLQGLAAAYPAPVVCRKSCRTSSSCASEVSLEVGRAQARASGGRRSLRGRLSRLMWGGQQLTSPAAGVCRNGSGGAALDGVAPSPAGGQHSAARCRRLVHRGTALRCRANRGLEDTVLSRKPRRVRVSLPRGHHHGMPPSPWSAAVLPAGDARGGDERSLDTGAGCSCCQEVAARLHKLPGSMQRHRSSQERTRRSILQYLDGRCWAGCCAAGAADGALPSLSGKLAAAEAWAVCRKVLCPGDASDTGPATPEPVQSGPATTYPV